ncbi:MAG: trypsin-like peptidase domain-containing protein [Bacteriovoracaceae bacterium]|nr:trypsin-like peptidase domain-containing protein [Bacteriovoracaceae bacterium]
MKQFTIILLATSFACHAGTASPYVVYGEDDRIEVFQSSPKLQKLANSTAGMIVSNKLVPVNGNIMLPPYTLRQDTGVCEGEKFSEQATPFICSGFLVGPDLLVTAGHCVPNEARCEDVSWVFDFKVDPVTGKTPVLTKKDNVYKCNKVIDAKLFNTRTNKYDYALIQLDRVVEARAPLKLRSSGKVKTNTKITVIGHPSGLPTKVASGAKVVANDKQNYFVADLDTFGGNSGSAVFDSETGTVEGILVRGAKDYETVDKCAVVNTTTQEITNFRLYGESVTRITDIATLKYRWELLEAAKSGDIKTVKLLHKIVPYLNMVYDNSKNSIVHIAAKNNRFALLKELAALGVDLDVKDLNGNTALHLAAKEGSVERALALIKLGSSSLVKNNKGLRPIDMASYLTINIKIILDKALKKELSSNKEALVLARD